MEPNFWSRLGIALAFAAAISVQLVPVAIDLIYR